MDNWLILSKMQSATSSLSLDVALLLIKTKVLTLTNQIHFGLKSLSKDFLVGLSRLDSNKYRRILAQIKNPQVPCNNTKSPKNASASTKINEFGEREVTKLKQLQKTFSETEIMEMVEEYRNGKTVYELAAQYGAHRVTVSKALKSYGVKVTKSKAQAKLDVATVIKLYEEYHTSGEIAKLYSVNPHCIIMCLRNHGITIRNRWDYPRR